MELLKLNEVNLTNLDQRFKQSPIGKLWAVIILLGFCGMFITFYFKGEWELGAATIATAICILIALFTFRMFLKNIGPNAWNLAVAPSVVYIKFRSFFNSHFPENDPQVVSLPFSEIKSLQINKQKLKYNITRNSKGGIKRTGTVTKYQTFLDITVNGIDLTGLAKQLHYEHTLKCSKSDSNVKSSVRHFPVRIVMPDTIRVEWFTKNTRLKPGINNAIEVLRQQHISIEELRNEVLDYTEIASQDIQEINKIVFELALRESKSAAVEVAKKKYDLDYKEAKGFVENLMDENAA